MRRLFSSFCTGAPGLGLLLFRLTSGISLVAQAVLALRGALPLAPPLLEPALLYTLTIGTELLLLVGLWTPVAGTMLAILAFSYAFFDAPARWNYVQMGILSVGLALLGPGAWSVDARLFGWKRIRISDR